MRDPLRPVPIEALIQAPSADMRIEGLDRLAAEGDLTKAHLAVDRLTDDAPFAFLHGDRVTIGEVRFRALITVEMLYRLAKRAPDFGPVQVCKAMPGDEAIRRAKEVLSAAPDPEALLERVDAVLEVRVVPGAPHREALRAYRVLQEAGEILYRTEEVDPSDWLTPLQREVSASQTVGPRPRPHLAVKEDAHRILGFLYRTDEKWTLDFAEDRVALKARQWVDLVLTTIEKGGVPNVVFDDDGTPRTHDDGSFVLDGVIPHDTAQPEILLRSVAAFTGRRYGTELVL